MRGNNFVNDRCYFEVRIVGFRKRDLIVVYGKD